MQIQLRLHKIDVSSILYLLKKYLRKNFFALQCLDIQGLILNAVYIRYTKNLPAWIFKMKDTIHDYYFTLTIQKTFSYGICLPLQYASYFIKTCYYTVWKLISTDKIFTRYIVLLLWLLKLYFMYTCKIYNKTI